MNEPTRGTRKKQAKGKEEWRRKQEKTRRYPQLRVITGGNEDSEGWHQPPLALGPFSANTPLSYSYHALKTTREKHNHVKIPSS